MSDALSEAKPAGAKSESSKLPGTGAFPAETAKKPVAESDPERNEVFTSLVNGDTDIVGLVAYSIYKQNKHDWLVAFNKLKSREPNEDEIFAYIAGESTPRRLATYRHLAEATLEGRGPTVNMGPASEKFVQRSLTTAHAAQSSPGGGGNTAKWIVTIIAALVAVLAAAKFGIPGLFPR